MKPLLFTAALLLFVACLDLSLRVGDTSHRLVAEPKNVATGVEGPSPVAALTPVRVVRSHVSPRHTAHLHRDTLNWQALAACESSGNPRAVDPSGTYFGLYQFDLRTWRGVGGRGLPSDATPAEQLHRAQLLFADRGRQPWPVCGVRL